MFESLLKSEFLSPYNYNNDYWVSKMRTNHIFQLFIFVLLHVVVLASIYAETPTGKKHENVVSAPLEARVKFTENVFLNVKASRTLEEVGFNDEHITTIS